MAQDLTSKLRSAAVNMAEDAFKNLSGSDGGGKKKKSGALTGAKGVAAGAGLAALVPLAKKGIDLVRSPDGAASGIGDKLGGKFKDTVSEKVDEAGGAGGIAKQAAGGIFGGGDDGDGGGGGGGMPGVGKGRRMPVQQAIDVAVPRETAYNQFTQFEEWPQFMHRVKRVTQEDDCTLSFATKIWGKTKEYTAKIETQRPDERIKWKVSQGITHTGVVTFHELAPELTRIEVNLDVDPGSLIEKAARGMRHVKRAVRADLHRFKAYIEMAEIETGAWRGAIEDGELVEEHGPDYDEERDYSDIEDMQPEEEGEQDEDEGAEEEDAFEDSRGEKEEEEEEEDVEPEEQRSPARARSRSRSSGRTSNSRDGDGGEGGRGRSRSTRSRRQPARR